MPTIELNRNQIEYSKDSSIDELMDYITLNLANDDQVFTRVELDGEAVGVNNEAELLATSVSQYETISFEMKNDQEITLDVLNTSDQYIDFLEISINDTCAAYKQGNLQLANENFIEMTEVVDLFIQLMTTIHSSINAETEIKLAKGQTLHKLELHLAGVLKTLIPAKENNDIILLCDLLEYELLDNLSQWKNEAIPALKELMGN